MAAFYLDSSALVKRYAVETGTAWVVGLVDPTAGNELFTVRLTGRETIAALYRKIRTAEASQVAMERAAARFVADWQRVFQVIDVTAAIADQAMLLARRYPLRGYDAVHLAAALEADDAYQHRLGLRVTLISADQDQPSHQPPASPQEERMSEQHDQDRKREPLVKVAVADNDFDAQLMHDELSAAGIRSMVRGQDVLASSLDVGIAAPFSREILVLESDAARAREILGDRAEG